MTNSMRSSTFVGSIGLNVHMDGFTTWANSQKLIGALSYLGVSNIRIVASDKFVATTGAVANLAKAGIKFDMLMPSYIDPKATMDLLKAFDAAHPDAIVAIEGPNEINNWPVTYNGLVGTAAANAFVSIAASEAVGTGLSDAKFFDFTGAPRSIEKTANPSGFINIHPYPQNGNQPGQTLLSAAARQAVAEKGLVITEAGYHTGLAADRLEGVNLATQAKLTLNLLADAIKLGASATYLYQLKDNVDPTGGLVDANLGLFDATLNAKPVATAIHNLTTILADDGIDAATFQTHSLNFTLQGLPSTGNSLLLEKSSGIHDILIWAEPDIWNETTNKPIAVAARTVKVGFEGPVNVRVYDPLVSDAAIATYFAVDSVTIAVSDHPVIVEVSGGAPRLASAPAVYATPIWQSGTTGNDILTGGAGNDRLSGLAGKDLIKGGDGDDWLYGAAGADTLSGGTGADTFVFKAAGESPGSVTLRDVITDFSSSEGDRIDISTIVANQIRVGRTPFFLAGDHFTMTPGELIQVRTADGILLQGDMLGTGRAAFSVMLLNLETPLSASDFIFG
ncbi:MAG: calcium-binding protein [Novosphingobium sp.]